jgi:diapolycopene oxygenase
MVRLDPQWRCFFDDGLVLDLEDNLQAMATFAGALKPGMGEGFLKFQQLSEQLHTISNKFFFWKPVGSMMDTLDLKGSVFDCRAQRCDAYASGADGRRNDSRVYSRRARGADAGSLHAVCRFFAGCFAGDFVRDRPYAVGGGDLVSDGRHARSAGGAGKAGPRVGVAYHPSTEVERLTIEGGKIAGLDDSRRDAAILTLWFRMKTRCAPIANWWLATGREF